MVSPGQQFRTPSGYVNFDNLFTIRLLNETGVLVPRGSAVRLSTTANNAFLYPTFSFDERVVGVARRDIAIGEVGEIVYSGVSFALVDSPVIPGNTLVTSGTDGELTPAGIFGDFGQLCWVLEAGGPGLVKVIVGPPSEVF